MKINKLFFQDKRFFRVMMLLGVMILCGVGFVSYRADLRRTAWVMQDTINYVGGQYIICDKFNADSTTKSLDRMVERVRQVRRDLELAGDHVNEEVLKACAEDLRLTGIVLLDPEGNITCEYRQNDEGWDELEEHLKKEALLNAARYPLKYYTTRLDISDGSLTDLAATARRNVPGVVVCYYHTPLQYSRNYKLSIQSVLSGYSAYAGSTIAITDGNRIIASNKETLVGMQVEDQPVLAQLRGQDERAGELIHIHADSAGYYGGRAVGRNYYIYVYFNEASIFTNLKSNVFSVLILYTLVLLVALVLRQKAAKEYQQEQSRRDWEYRRNLEEKAREAQRANHAKTEFLQRMSHDIRTPINGIRGMLEMADYYQDDLKKQTECRNKIREASGFLLELINDVLDMGKLESGEVTLEERPFELKELLDGMVEIVSKQARERGIEIVVRDYEVRHWHLLGSPLHLKRLYMNIMSNAVKYNKDKGKIFVECRETSSREDIAEIEFICQDTGIGMKPEFQKHVFDPFVQESNTARTSYGGTGLGLAIVKNLIEKMGGTITFESEPGVGSTFYLTVPFKIDQNAAAQEHVAQEEKNASIRGMHILIAEDNELNMEIAQFVLESAGAVLSRAMNGKEALECFQASAPGTFDVILMDVMMPAMDGFEATWAIRALDREDAKTIPIIAMTANAFAEDRKRAFEAGMNEHLAKPLESRQMKEVIAAYSGKKMQADSIAQPGSKEQPDSKVQADSIAQPDSKVQADSTAQPGSEVQPDGGTGSEK